MNGGLTIEALDVVYPGGAHAVRGVDLVVPTGTTVALVGESGCGKSTIADTIIGLLPRRTVTTGRVWLAADGTDSPPIDLLDLSERDRQAIRGTRIGYVTQDPFDAFDPIRPVGHHVTAAWRVHGLRPEPGKVTGRLESLGIVDAARRARLRPHQWSGGMLQRASIAAAGALQPDLIVADEPTSALDSALSFTILAALRADAKAVLLITHDLILAATVADHIYVLYGGTVVEEGPAGRVAADPTHPYTKALLAAVPRGRSLPRPLPGDPPDPYENPAGCSFAPRCGLVKPACLTEAPVLLNGAACHQVRP